MHIRPFNIIEDTDSLKHITAVCFDGVCIDQNIENQFGLVAGHDWRYRKLRHIDNDIAANPSGIFVAEIDSQVVGYISTHIDPEIKVGSIPNLAVLPNYQKHGIGRRLIETAIEYAKEQGMAILRIETMLQNHIGLKFYPQMGFTEVARQAHYAMTLE